MPSIKRKDDCGGGDKYIGYGGRGGGGEEFQKERVEILNPRNAIFQAEAEETTRRDGRAERESGEGFSNFLVRFFYRPTTRERNPLICPSSPHHFPILGVLLVVRILSPFAPPPQSGTFFLDRNDRRPSNPPFFLAASFNFSRVSQRLKSWGESEGSGMEEIDPRTTDDECWKTK